MFAQLDARGVLIPGTRQDAEVTPDGYAVNTLFPTHPPYPANIRRPTAATPDDTDIGDRLNQHDVSGMVLRGWNDAVAGHPNPLFQFHHQPFVYFARYAPDTARAGAPQG